MDGGQEDDAPLRRAKVLTVCREARHESVLRTLIEGAEDLQDLGNARSLLQVERTLSSEGPQIVIVDRTALSDADLVLEAVRGARVRHVVQFSDEASPSDRSVLAASILDDRDAHRLDAVKVRLSLLASRSVRARRLSSTSLRAATAAAVARGGSIREPVRRIVDTPLEVIALFGDGGGRAAAEGTVRSVSRVRVPTILAVNDTTPLDVQSLRETAKAPIDPLDESLMIKRLPRGILIPTRPRGLFFESGSVCISRVEEESLGGAIASLAPLGAAAAVVLLAGSDPALCASLHATAIAGVPTFALESTLGTTSPAAASAIDTGVAEPMSFGELSWMLDNAVPFRE